MEKEQYKYLPVAEEESTLNIREILSKYLRHWPWFLVLLCLTLGIAVAYLKLGPKTYQTVSSIIINDEENGGSSGSSSNMQIDLLSGLKTNSIANELGLLRSKRLMFNTAKALNLNVAYLDDSGFIKKELYNQSPVTLQFLRFDEKALLNQIVEENNTYRIRKKGTESFELINEKTNEKKIYKYDTPIELGFADFIVKINSQENSFSEEWESVIILFLPLNVIAENYSKKLAVNIVEEKSTLLELGLEDRVSKKAEDILNQLIYEYNKEAIEDKNLIAKNTADFIDERLQIINGELDSVESGKENYKEQNRLTDIGVESSMLIQNVSEFNREQQQIQTQLELTQSILSYADNDSYNLFPSNLGLENSASNELISEYNALVIERNRLAASSTEQNPVVKGMSDQINRLKYNLKSNLEGTRNNLMIAEDNLRRKSGSLGFQMSQIPGQERQVRGIERQQGIKEALYLYLLQKREENTLALSVSAPKAKIVDEAFSTRNSISPSPKVVLGGAILLALLIPVVFIRGRELWNNKIESRTDVEKGSKDVPILGELPKLGKKDSEFILKNDRSVLAESFRILSANLQYAMINNASSNNGKTIFVTSTTKGEGKTFVAVNLAITLALSGKKVLLVGGDLRNPQLHRFDTNLKKVFGVSDYLVNRTQNLSELYQDTELHESLKILPSGSIPPNPAELFQMDRLGTMFEQLEQEFDYIVVDTAPALLVADTFLINRFALVTLYVVRSEVTKKEALQFVNDSKRSGKLKNVSLVINDLKLKNFAYGNKYGYSYGD
ncbi:GumC family protein [Cellulophaga baltica]|uniref:GumC family protein n=1 Tax=Cellulophaga baltica TaxID=76594 RepID=UPI00249534BA|nr:polysaccharide biosynthesis tyrosine autokinase [Cellulophaga baltica]